MHFWPKFGNTDFNWWWLFARTSSKWGKFWLLSSIWPWSSRSIVPQNKRDLNQGLFHLWSKFGDSSLNGWWVIARTSWWLTDRHTHTHRQATTIPEGQNWPRVKRCDRQTDGRTDGQTDRRTDWTSHIAAWSQLKTIGHLFYATSSFVQHFVAIGEFKLELESGNTQSGSNSTLFRAMWPWTLMDDLQKQ